jgi:hypothetical protein
MTITIAGKELISKGTKPKSGEPWTLWKVTDTNGKKHSTFLEGIEIGETYQFIQELKPFVSKKDGKTYQSSNLTGFDNVSKPVAAPENNLRLGEDGFTNEDRKNIGALLTLAQNIYKYLSGEEAK